MNAHFHYKFNSSDDYVVLVVVVNKIKHFISI